MGVAKDLTSPEWRWLRSKGTHAARIPAGQWTLAHQQTHSQSVLGAHCGTGCRPRGPAAQKGRCWEEGGTLWLSSSLPLRCLIDWCTIDLSCSLATADHGLLSFPGRLSLKQAGLPLCFSLHFANPFLLIVFQSSTLIFHLCFHLFRQSCPQSLLLCSLPRGTIGCIVSISPSSYLFPFSACELSPFLKL